MKTYTTRRKADRAAMAAAIVALCEQHGASATVEPGHDDEASTRLVVSVDAGRGLQACFGLDGRSPQPDIHVIPWNISTASDARLANAFGEVNPHHFCKSTQVAYGFAGLMANLERALTMAADGSAFSAEREALAIAKNGTAAARMAQWAEWRAEEAAKRAA